VSIFIDNKRFLCEDSKNDDILFSSIEKEIKMEKADAIQQIGSTFEMNRHIHTPI